MALIGAVSPEMMEQIVRYVTRQIVSGTASADSESELGIHFINTTGEEIPPYGVFQAHETRNDVFMPAVVIAKKPIDAAANASAIFVNGPNAVENNGFGYAQPGPLYKVLHDGTAAAGDSLGLTDDSFEASPGTGPFVAIGEDDVSENVFLCLLAAGSGSGGKSGHCVLPQGSPAAEYSTSISLGGTITNSVTPGRTGGYKLKWAVTTYDATIAVATRTLELVSPLYNPLPIALPNDAVVQWKENDDGFKMIDTWICGTGVSSPGGGANPNPGDPVNGGSSKSVSMGYTMDV